MLQKLIYSIFVFLSSIFLIFMFLIFRIIFGRTCYGTTVIPLEISIHQLRFKYIWIYAWILDNLTVNILYTRSQNYTNMVVGEHRMQAFEVVFIVLLLLLL